MTVELLYRTPYMDQPDVYTLPSDDDGNVETSEFIAWLEREWGSCGLTVGDSFTLAADE